MGHSAQVVLNAANEVAVKKFLDKEITYTEIPRMIEKSLDNHKVMPLTSVEEILALDKKVRDELMEEYK